LNKRLHRSTSHSRFARTAAFAGAFVAASFSAATAVPLDQPALSVVEVGSGRVDLRVTAGPSGTPAGFTLWWMTRSEFEANGNQWFPYGDPRQAECYFVGAPTLNNFPGEPGTFLLGPNESITIQPGDLVDETGIISYYLDEHEYSTDYVYCVFANAGDGWEQSDYSANNFATTTNQFRNCTFTIGYWKTHEDQWPVSSLTLGNVSYTQAQLLAILDQPTQGNGLVSLAKQLIAAKLNVANGADASAVSSTIASSDALIGNLVVPPFGSGYLAPSSTSALTETLDDYNNGIIGPGHCEETTVACCLPDGTCEDLSADECVVAGGISHGSGSTCATTSCTESCEYPDGSCQDVPPNICEEGGGVPGGDNTQCLPAACCAPDGSCQLLTSEQCIAAGGIPQGTGSTCSTVICEQPPQPEACCFSDGSCQELFADACISAGGIPQGAGTTCATVNCPQPPPRGACCLPDGACVDDVEESACVAGSGTWYANGTCAEVTCTNAVEPSSWGKIKGIYR
jgi:hypothetical protein